MRRSLLPGAVLGWLLAGPLLAAEEAAPVSVASVEHTTPQAQWVLPGTVLARRSALLSVEVAGVVAELGVDDGDAVRTGDTLLRLRERPQVLALEAARADVRRAQAEADFKRVTGTAGFPEALKAAPVRSAAVVKRETRKAGQPAAQRTGLTSRDSLP